MANVLVNEKTLKAIADAVRARGGTSALMKPGEIPDAVSRIPSGGSAADMSLPVRFFDYDGTLLYSLWLIKGNKKKGKAQSRRYQRQSTRINCDYTRLVL